MDKSVNEQGDLSKYVVRGAMVKCTLGTCPDVLNMPFSHGVFLKDKPQLNVADSVSGANIKCFGACAKSSPPPPCTPVFCGQWINVHKTHLKIENKDALIQDANLMCASGGIVSIETCGQ
jgi:hypothetical protein